VSAWVAQCALFNFVLNFVIAIFCLQLFNESVFNFAKKFSFEVTHFLSLSEKCLRLKYFFLTVHDVEERQSCVMVVWKPQRSIKGGLGQKFNHKVYQQWQQK
jgi:hypothetical protein